MEIIQTLFSQSIRFGDIIPSVGQQIYGRNLVKIFEEKYGFIEVPQKAADFDLTKGISFLHGFYKNSYVIDRVQIYNNGLLVETKYSTDICEDLIDDIIDWSASILDINFTENKSLPRLFNNQFELKSRMDLDNYISPIFVIQDALRRVLSSYGDVQREYNLSGLAFLTDPTENGPGPFKVERRTGRPFSENLYFSTAPLKSQDHFALLQTLEDSLKA